MRMTATKGVALALLAIGSLHQAQTVQKPAGQKAAEATAPAEPDVSWHFPVTGLTKDNAPAVKTALTALSMQAYVCEPCKVEQAKAGKCPKCSADLQVAQRPVLGAVTLAPEDSSLTLSLNPKHVTRLSDIEAALKKGGITTDAAKMPLPGKLTLVVKGATADKAPAVEKALMEAKLFDEAHAMFDAATSELRVVARSATAPMRANVAATIEAQKMQLGDVYFGRVREM